MIGPRSIPFRAGSAGGDKIAFEYSSRLAANGFQVTVYNRIYAHDQKGLPDYRGIHLVYIRTVKTAGFDSFLHAAKATFHVIRHNVADVVIVGNPGNSIWSLFLRLFGKKAIVWVDGIDWKRDKWPWYAKWYLYLSSFLAATLPNVVVFDNIFAKEIYEKKFGKRFEFIKNGADEITFQENREILDKYGLIPGEYFLFVGRFIPDKGLHYLIPAFETVKTSKKLVLVGGSPNPSEYEKRSLHSADPRIIKPGYIYGDDVYTLMKHAYMYIQPSDVEGLSPVIQQIMAFGTPLLCSDIQENLYVVDDTAQTFRKSDVSDLAEKIDYSLKNPDVIKALAIRAKERILREFSWEASVKHLTELITS